MCEVYLQSTDLWTLRELFTRSHIASTSTCTATPPTPTPTPQGASLWGSRMHKLLLDDRSLGRTFPSTLTPLNPSHTLQVANLWGRGVDKLPFDERVAWARQQLPAIRASAARPLEPAGGAGSWWRQGEKPWQLLATCFEIDEALASGSPEAYVSFQPVLQVGGEEGNGGVWVRVWVTAGAVTAARRHTPASVPCCRCAEGSCGAAMRYCALPKSVMLGFENGKRAWRLFSLGRRPPLLPFRHRDCVIWTAALRRTVRHAYRYTKERVTNTTTLKRTGSLQQPLTPVPTYVHTCLLAQDGTCNGLQHYAALARDEVCGAAVNLLPADKPGDVYTVRGQCRGERGWREG